MSATRGVRWGLVERLRAGWYVVLDAFEAIDVRLSRVATVYRELWNDPSRSRAIALLTAPAFGVAVLLLLVLAAAVRVLGVALAVVVLAACAALAAAPVIGVAWAIVAATGSQDAEAPARSAACDPAYVDVCIPEDAGDFDCPGGLGAGPYVRGARFEVRGPDVHRLDGDGDGVACESSSAD